MGNCPSLKDEELLKFVAWDGNSDNIVYIFLTDLELTRCVCISIRGEVGKRNEISRTIGETQVPQSCRQRHGE